MRLRVHLPTSFDVPDDWDPAQAARLHQVVARAMTRAVGSLQVPGVRVEVVAASEPTALAPPRAPAAARAAPRERLESVRFREGDSTYDVPSFDDQGEPTPLPVRPEGGETFEGVSITAGDGASVLDQPELEFGGDIFERRTFPRRTVLSVLTRRGRCYVFAGGDVSVVAENLARAIAWGKYLFRSGYAILQPIGKPNSGPFRVVGLTEPLTNRDVGGDPALRNQTLEGELISPRGYLTVLVAASDGHWLLRRTGPWSELRLGRAIADLVRTTPAERLAPSAEDLDVVASYLLRRGKSSGGDEGQIALLVNMDRTLFASMDWETRSGYLDLLTRNLGLDDRLRSAILEIIHASHSESELEAIFARLRARGVYESLFDHLDGQVYDLLQYLGEFREAEPVDWTYLLNILAARGLITLSIMTDPVGEIGRIWAGAKTWVLSLVDGVKMILTRPDEVVEGLGHLAELIYTVERAKMGDPKARAFVNEMVRRAGASVLKAIRGLRYAEELGTPYGRRGSDTKIADDLLGKLQYALICEVASWFIGIGQIKAAIAATGLAEKFALIVKFLGALRIVGKVAGAGAEVARLERVLAALAKVAEIADRARLARIVELLPEAHLSALERLAKAVDLAEGADAAALRAALTLRGDAELLRAVDEVADALAVAAALEARVGEQAAGMAAGLARLLNDSGLGREALIRLVRRVPADRLGEFMHTLTFVKPEHLVKWGEKGLGELAEHPNALEFTRHAGSEIMDSLGERSGLWGNAGLPQNVWDRARKSTAAWDKVEELLEGLESARRGDPQAYQDLLVRIGKGERSAFEEALEARHGRRLAEAEKAGTLADFGMSRLRGGRRFLREEMEELAAHDHALWRRRAEQIGRLPEKQLDGLEQLARLEAERFDWAEVLDHLPEADRADLLEPLAEVGPLCIRPGVDNGGLDAVIKGIIGRNVRKPEKIVKGVQGSWGQLMAGRTLARRGATRLRFEVTGGALRRDADIIAEIGGREVSVEVKTNLEADASRNLEQMRRDLVNHAGSDYQGLLYMYHPNEAGQLPGVGRSMLRQLDDPRVQAEFAKRGLDLEKARGALQRWIDSGGITTFTF